MTAFLAVVTVLPVGSLICFILIVRDEVSSYSKRGHKA